MRVFDFKITPELEEILDNIISCLLPHQNFDVVAAKLVIEELHRTISVTECNGIYYIFMKALTRLAVVKMYLSNVSSVLRRDMFETAVSSSIEDIVLDRNFNAVAFFMAYGKSYELSVPEQLEEAVSFAYSEAMSKYDELFEKAIVTAEGLNWINLLKQRMETELTKKVLSVAANILVEGKSEDKNLRRGALESRKFLVDALADVNQRVASIYSDAGARNTATTITSYDASKQFDERNKIQARDLYYTGIDPIDQAQPIRTQDIITIIADEGIGKTRFAIDQAYKAVMSGVNILYICGETAQIKIKKYLESAHLYSMYQLQLKWSEISDPTTIEGVTIEELEDINIKISAALADLYENENYGSITLVQSLDYEDFEEKVSQYKDKCDIDLVIVDHILALGSTGAYTTLGRLITKQLRVSYLYECEDKLVKQCNIAFLNTSHPSTATSADLRNGRTPGPRSGAESADSTRYSSLVGVLNNSSELRKQDFVLLYMTKMREELNNTDAIVLKRTGYTNIHIYDPKYQYLGEGKSTGKIGIDDSLFVSEEGI